MATPESCDPKINQTCIAQGAPKRNNYFSGKYISAEDLTLEQEYFINKIKQMNSELSGYGIINGLTISRFNNTDQHIVVNPGIGIDSCGNALVIYNETKFTLPDKLNDGDYIYLRFLEKGKDRVARSNDEECGDECCYNHIVEDMVIYLDETLLTLEANDICSESKEMKNHHKLEYLEKASTPFLLLGRYKYVGKQGKIDNSDRVILHTNAELSKRLCYLLDHHVRSVNGEYGDVTAVSTINSAKPDEDGDFEIIAGNNISISSEENRVTIATKGGFHQTYIFSLIANKKYEISHQQSRYPIVDVYEAIEIKNTFIAYEHKELLMKARDLNIAPEIYFDSIGAQPLEEYIDKFEKPITRGLKKTGAYTTSKKMTKNVLDSINIRDYSLAVTKSLAKEIRYNLSSMMVTKHYKYEKIVGAKNALNIKVTHLDSNRVEVQNLDEQGSVNLMVILNT